MGGVQGAEGDRESERGIRRGRGRVRTKRRRGRGMEG